MSAGKQYVQLAVDALINEKLAIDAKCHLASSPVQEHLIGTVKRRTTPTVTGILLAGKQYVIERIMPTSQAALQP